MRRSSGAPEIIFHLDLAHLRAEREYTLHVGLASYPIERHTEESRIRFRRDNGALSRIPDAHLTHYAPGVRAPAESVSLIRVTTPSTIEGEKAEHLAALAIHVPSDARRRARQRKRSGTSVKASRLGIESETDREQLDLFLDPTETAKSLVAFHPQLLSTDPSTEATVLEHIELSGVEDLSQKIEKLGERWVSTEPARDEEGNPLRDPDTGEILYVHHPAPELAISYRGPASRSMKTTQNDGELEGELWTVQDGVTAEVYTGLPSREGVVAVPIPRPGAPLAPYTWQARSWSPFYGVTLDHDSIRFTPGGDEAGTLELDCRNHYLRHLGGCVQFLSIDGRPVSNPNPNPKWLPSAFSPQDGASSFVDVVGPVGTFYGVPLAPDPTHLRFQVPDDAHTARLLFGGAGHGTTPYDPSLVGVGMVLTAMLEYGLPMFLLLAGEAAERAKIADDVIEAMKKNPRTAARLLTSGVALALGEECVRVGTPLPLIKKTGVLLIKVLLKSAIKEVITAVLGKAGFKKAVPVAGLITFAISTAVTAAELAETTNAVLSSPFVIANDLTRFMKLQVTVVPDSRFRKFPDLATHYSLVVEYDVGTTYRAFTHRIEGVKSDPIRITLTDVPAGGRLKVCAYFYAENDWIAGSGKTAEWVAAKPDPETNTLTMPDLEIRTERVPITVHTRYRHKAKIGWDDSKKAHVWKTTSKPPEETQASLDPSPGTKSLAALGRITLAQYPAMMGYSWQAWGLELPKDRPGPPSPDCLHVFQNLSILEDPKKGFYLPRLGFSLAAPLSYELEGDRDGSGWNFFLDPRKAPDGGYHLRRLRLDSDADFKELPRQSFGRFPLQPDSFAVHPSGYALGVNYSTSKLMLVELAAAAMPDDEAPQAHLLSGEGERPGLLRGPVAVAVALKGHFVVLESLNRRVQAFDMTGNPVPCFTGDRYWFELEAPPGETAHYLDMGTEAAGYIYVLSYSGQGRKAGEYHLSIYGPEGIFVARTGGVAAAAIAVSYLRNVYGLNYEQIPGADGRPEPSVSLWIPSPPPGTS